MTVIGNTRLSLSRLRIGHTKLTHDTFDDRNDQQQTCTNATWRNQMPTIKHCLKEYPQWRYTRKNKISKAIKECDWEVEKKIKFFKEIGI